MGNSDLEVMTVSAKVRVKHSQLDAAGSSDWEYVDAVQEYDLSHIGAVKIIQHLVDLACANQTKEDVLILLEKYKQLNGFNK